MNTLQRISSFNQLIENYYGLILLYINNLDRRVVIETNVLSQLVQLEHQIFLECKLRFNISDRRLIFWRYCELCHQIQVSHTIYLYYSGSVYHLQRPSEMFVTCNGIGPTCCLHKKAKSYCSSCYKQNYKDIVRCVVCFSTPNQTFTYRCINNNSCTYRTCCEYCFTNDTIYVPMKKHKYDVLKDRLAANFGNLQIENIRDNYVTFYLHNDINYVYSCLDIDNFYDFQLFIVTRLKRDLNNSSSKLLYGCTCKFDCISQCECTDLQFSPCISTEPDCQCEYCACTYPWIWSSAQYKIDTTWKPKAKMIGKLLAIINKYKEDFYDPDKGKFIKQGQARFEEKKVEIEMEM